MLMGRLIGFPIWQVGFSSLVTGWQSALRLRMQKRTYYVKKYKQRQAYSVLFPIFAGEYKRPFWKR